MKRSGKRLPRRLSRLVSGVKSWWASGEESEESLYDIFKRGWRRLVPGYLVAIAVVAAWNIWRGKEPARALLGSVLLIVVSAVVVIWTDHSSRKNRPAQEISSTDDDETGHVGPLDEPPRGGAVGDGK